MFRLATARFLQSCLPFLALFAASSTYGQQTIFDVPSADVLDKGKVYGELDGTARPLDPLATFTPRVVIGVGHRIEAGVNFNGLAAPTTGQLEISPTVKWRLWKREVTGWSLYGISSRLSLLPHLVTGSTVWLLRNVI